MTAKGEDSAQALSALPDLLEACESLLHELITVYGAYDITKLAVIQKAEEAIAKAKGEKGEK